MSERFVYLMCKDTPVMQYNVDSGRYTVLNNELMPYMLKDKFRDIPKTAPSEKELERLLNLAGKNNEAYNGWLSYRLLPIDRENAKRIVLALGNDPVPKLKLIYLCRGLSVIDNYWLTTNTSTKWKDVNIREVSLSESIAMAALHGKSVTLQGQPLTPEVTNQGAYAKAWLRRDGALWLYKKGAKDATESRIEVMVSKILDKCNVRHVHYELATEDDPVQEVTCLCCRCKCISDDSHMIVPAMDYNSYCNSHDLNFDLECIRIDSIMYYKMAIVDYLIANKDRHSMNWGFFADGNTNNILCMHPLFDHNNAFDNQYMQEPDSYYQARVNITLHQAATHAMRKVDFHFTEEITCEDFITDRQYKMFMSRANELGIKTDTSEMYTWMHDNAPEAVKDSNDAELKEYMYSSWLDYLRNSYDLDKLSKQ